MTEEESISVAGVDELIKYIIDHLPGEGSKFSLSYQSDEILLSNGWAHGWHNVLSGPQTLGIAIGQKLGGQPISTFQVTPKTHEGRDSIAVKIKKLA